MAITRRIRFRNKVQPLEQVTENSRFYLDSDVGTTLKGEGEVAVSSINHGTSNITKDFGTGITFVFIKCNNIQAGTVTISLNPAGDDPVISLLQDEAFATEISTSAVIKVKCAADEDSTIEYFVTK